MAKLPLAEHMNIPHQLLSILRCPQTLQSLDAATSDQLAQINASIASDDVIDGEGKSVSTPLAGALVVGDRSLAYPIDDGYPVLLLQRQLRKKDAGHLCDLS